MKKVVWLFYICNLLKVKKRLSYNWKDMPIYIVLGINEESCILQITSTRYIKCKKTFQMTYVKTEFKSTANEVCIMLEFGSNLLVFSPSINWSIEIFVILYLNWLQSWILNNGLYNQRTLIIWAIKRLVGDNVGSQACANHLMVDP